jgi:hypothetical protein
MTYHTFLENAIKVSPYTRHFIHYDTVQQSLDTHARAVAKEWVTKPNKKTRDFSPQANYTDPATAACRRSYCNFSG